MKQTGCFRAAARRVFGQGLDDATIGVLNDRAQFHSFIER